MFKGEDVAIARPTASAEIRIIGIDDSTTKEEVKYTIADIGECQEDSIKVGEIKRMTNGLGLIWIRCPIQTAYRVTAIGRIRMGWTMVRVELLEKRPIQCYRCWEYGHVKFSCKSEKDRDKRCYNCGELGHTARTCESVSPICIVCKEKGYEANHRIGSRWCRVRRIQDKGRQPVGRKEAEVSLRTNKGGKDRERREGQEGREEKVRDDEN